jgi:hypothetical protein
MRTDMAGTLTGSSWAWAVLASLPWIRAGGCTPTQKAAPDAPEAGADAAPSARVSAATSAATEGADPQGGDEIRPVYPVDAGPPDPLAERFCDAVVVLPERRKSECCGTPNVVAPAIRAQCVRTLTFALAQRAVALPPPDVDRCVEAMNRTTSGCDWVTPFSEAPPAECDGIVKGMLKEKAPCRSSLECAEGLRCQGLSTVDLGACGPPKVPGSQCNVAVDMLATMTRQDRFARAHPECAGYCARGRCNAAVPVGGDCTNDLVCGSGRCASGKCTDAPPAAAGESCTDTCAAGARCVKGKCAAPKAEGASCDADAECRGTCVRGDGGAAGTCAKSCPVFNLAPPPVPRASGRPVGAPPKRR